MFLITFSGYTCLTSYSCFFFLSCEINNNQPSPGTTTKENLCFPTGFELVFFTIRETAYIPKRTAPSFTTAILIEHNLNYLFKQCISVVWTSTNVYPLASASYSKRTHQ